MIRIAAIRSQSARLTRTARQAAGSVLASLNGSVSWMYRLAESTTSRQIRCKAAAYSNEPTCWRSVADQARQVEPVAPAARVDRVGPFEPAVEVLEAHRQDAAVEVAQVVGQAAVVGLGEPLERELAVAAERALAHEVVAERLDRELLDQLHRLDDVAQALAEFLDLAGLLVLAIDEAMPEDPQRQRHAGRHQHRRPECAVEPRDVLADDVHVGRPEPAEPLVIGPVADRR